MAEDEQKPEAQQPEPEPPEAEMDTPEEEAPVEEPASAEEAPVEEESPVAEEAPAEEPAVEEDTPAPAEAPAEEAAEEELSPKALRKQERSRASGPARPSRSPEERAAERAERRRADAASRRRYRATRRGKRGEPGVGTKPAERAAGARKVRLGTVVSSKADKTITVRTESARRHAVYEKVVRRSGTLHAHDERNEASEGDIVRVIETRPLSRLKRWRLLEVVEKAR